MRFIYHSMKGGDCMTNSLESKETLWQEYLSTNPKEKELYEIIVDQKESPFLRGKALEALFEREHLKHWVVKCIILFAEEFRGVAWEKFKGMSPDASDLDDIFVKFPEYREEIKDIFGRTSAQMLMELRGLE